MNDLLYVVIIEKTKSYNKLNKDVVVRHVGHIRALDEAGKIALCGAFKGYPGVAGMVVLRAGSAEEADEMYKSDPLVTEGYATYSVRTLMAANKENNYLL